MREKQGFTLIETALVLMLLGILAAVAVPKYLDGRKTGERHAAEAAAAEAQARMNAVFGGALLEGSPCAEARNRALDFNNLSDEGVEETSRSSGRIGDFLLTAYWNDGSTARIDAVSLNGSESWESAAVITLPVCEGTDTRTAEQKARDYLREALERGCGLGYYDENADANIPVAVIESNTAKYVMDGVITDMDGYLEAVKPAYNMNLWTKLTDPLKKDNGSISSGSFTTVLTRSSGHLSGIVLDDLERRFGVNIRSAEITTEVKVVNGGKMFEFTIGKVEVND